MEMNDKKVLYKWYKIPAPCKALFIKPKKYSVDIIRVYQDGGLLPVSQHSFFCSEMRYEEIFKNRSEDFTLGNILKILTDTYDDIKTHHWITEWFRGDVGDVENLKRGMDRVGIKRWVEL